MLTHRWPAAQRPARVVILGASGFVGRYAAAHAEVSGLHVLRLGSRDVDLCAAEAPELLGRLLRPEDALVVTSAVTPDKGRDAKTLLRNLLMGQHLSEALTQVACAHVVYVSSDAVYADDVVLARESSCASPSSFHGLMHLTRERMLAQATAHAGTPLAILRPCALYGVDDPHNAYGPNRFVRSALLERRIVLFGRGEERRDHLCVTDLGRVIGGCLQRRSEGIVNVGSGRAVSFGQLAREVAARCSAPVRIDETPRQNPVTHRHVDLGALRRAFPTLRLMPFGEGFSQMVEALRPSSADQTMAGQAAAR